MTHWKGVICVDYIKSYLMLFNAITDALEKIDSGDIAGSKRILIHAQQAAEDYYIKSGDNSDIK